MCKTRCMAPFCFFSFVINGCITFFGFHPIPGAISAFVVEQFSTFSPPYLILGVGLGLWRHVGLPISFLLAWQDQRVMSHGMLEKNLKESDRHRHRQKNDKKPQSMPLPLLPPLARENFKESERHQHLQKEVTSPAFKYFYL